MWYDLNQQQPVSHIDIQERVIAYGDGFFTTMAVVNGQINWLDYHRQRIQQSCQALMFAINQDVLLEQLKNHAKILQIGVLKLIICRANQPIRGYGFSNKQTNIWLNCQQIALPFLHDVNQIAIQPITQAICLNQQISSLPMPLAGLKLLNAQDKVLASHELYQHQQLHHLPMTEGLVQNLQGEWVEGTISNVFYQLDNQQWFTPPIIQAGVKGVMRQVLLDNWRPNANAVNERALQTTDFPRLTGLFFCNAVRGIIPIEQLIVFDKKFIIKKSSYQHIATLF